MGRAVLALVPSLAARHSPIINVPGQAHGGPDTRAIRPARQDRAIWPPLEAGHHVFHWYV